MAAVVARKDASVAAAVAFKRYVDCGSWSALPRFRASHHHDLQLTDAFQLKQQTILIILLLEVAVVGLPVLAALQLMVQKLPSWKEAASEAHA